MPDNALEKGPLDAMMRAALKRFKIGSKGLALIMQKGRAGPEFKFRPVHYDLYADSIIFHERLVSEKVKASGVQADVLLNYLMNFGVGLAAEMRRMSSTGVCPLFNFVEPDTRRRWYKMHWTRLEEEANSFALQVLEFNVDRYLDKVRIRNPVPVSEHVSYLKGLRKEDVSKFHKELNENLLRYVSRARFSSETAASTAKLKDQLEGLARSAAGPKKWFYLNRAIKKLRFGQPESYKEGYPALVQAVYPEIEVHSHDTSMAGLPEREKLPRTWKGKSCTFFEWRLGEENKA